MGYKDYINSKNDLRFDKRNELGKWGEKKAKEFFDLKGFNYKDVSDIYKYQIIDVDFLVEINGIDEMVETKTFKDLIEKGTLMIKYYTEYLNEEMAQKKGNDAWYVRTQAKYLVFVCRSSSKIIIVNFNALKEYIDKFKDTRIIRKTKFFDEDKQANGLYDRYNHVYYLNIEHMMKEINVDGRELMKIYTDLM